MRQLYKKINRILCNGLLAAMGFCVAQDAWAESIGAPPIENETARTSDREGRARQGYNAEFHGHHGPYGHEYYGRHRYNQHEDQGYYRRNGQHYEDWGDWGWGWDWKPAPVDSGYWTGESEEKGRPFDDYNPNDYNEGEP